MTKETASVACSYTEHSLRLKPTHEIISPRLQSLLNERTKVEQK